MAPEKPSELALIEHREGVAALLPGLRRKILEQLHSEPDSATGLARKLGLTRQKVNYHVRTLQKAGFLELSGQEKRRGCTERLFRPAARSYLICPDLLGDLQADPEKLQDRFSSAYLITLAARLARDVARLRQGADQAGKRLATLALQVDVRFASAERRHAFAEELTEAVARLAARYQDDSPKSRSYRFVVGGHPAVTDPHQKGEEEHDSDNPTQG